MLQDLEAGKTEMATEFACMRQLLEEYEARLTASVSNHNKHDNRFHRVENQIIDFVAQVTRTKDHLEHQVSKDMKTWKYNSEKKLMKFVECIMSEFKYMSKRCEDKVLFEVGYHDKLWREDPHQPVKFGDLVSQSSVPSLPELGSEIHKRPNSVHEFKPGKSEDLISVLDYESELERAWARSL